MDRNKAIEWLFNGHTGLSSMTMCAALLGVEYGEHTPPYDNDDLCRCITFGQWAKLTKSDLDKIVSIYPYFKPIADNWEKINSKKWIPYSYWNDLPIDFQRECRQIVKEAVALYEKEKNIIKIEL